MSLHLNGLTCVRQSLVSDSTGQGAAGDQVYVVAGGELVWPEPASLGEGFDVARDGGTRSMLSGDAAGMDVPISPWVNRVVGSSRWSSCEVEIRKRVTAGPDISLGLVQIPSEDVRLQYNQGIPGGSYDIANDAPGVKSKYRLTVAHYPDDFCVRTPSPGQPPFTFTQGVKYFTPDYSYYISFQADGNLVVYNSTDNKPIWALNNVVAGEAWRGNTGATFDSDSNLTVFKDGATVWQVGVGDRTEKRFALLALSAREGRLTIRANDSTFFDSSAAVS